jgi:hypothetical protein
MFFFFPSNFVILSHWWSNPQGDVVTFGYRLALKVKKKKNPFISWLLASEMCRNMTNFEDSKFFFTNYFEKKLSPKNKMLSRFYAWIVWALRLFTITRALIQFMVTCELLLVTELLLLVHTNTQGYIRQNVRPNENYDIPIFRYSVVLSPKGRFQS